jgi:diphthamide biosynthesis enzyme Dph1/Dph2-like protein
MEIEFIKSKYIGEFKIPENLLKILNENFQKNSKIVIFSSIQFIHFLPKLQSFLKNEKFQIILTKPKKTTCEGQILGCNSYISDLNLKEKIDGFIYIGDGLFHPKALFLAYENEDKQKPIIIINPINNNVSIFKDENFKKYFKKKKANLAKFYMNDEIGIFISSKWGQEQKDKAIKLKKNFPQKNFYFFIGDLFSNIEIENFPFIKCWVNTACRRIGQDDILDIKKPVINLEDLEFTKSKK